MEEIRIKGNLSPNFINDKLGPFLDALQNIQHTIDEINQVPPSPIKVNEIQWEGVDTLDDEILSDMPRVTVLISEAQKALAGLRETLDYLNEEPSNQDLHFASVRMAKSLYEALSLSVENDVEDYLETRYFAQQIGKTIRFQLHALNAGRYTITPLFAPDEKATTKDAEAIAKSLSWLGTINTKKWEEK